MLQDTPLRMPRGPKTFLLVGACFGAASEWLIVDYLDVVPPHAGVLIWGISGIAFFWGVLETKRAQKLLNERFRFWLWTSSLFVGGLAIGLLWPTTPSGKESRVGQEDVRSQILESTETFEPTHNKYVCINSVRPLGDGQYGLIVEFGVHDEPTDGFFGAVVGIRYDAANHWFHRPLRTDIGRRAGVLFDAFEEKRSGLYARGFSSPSITPDKSLYLYFESNEPMVPDGVVFGNFLDAGDMIRLRESALSYGPCPIG